MTNHVLSFSIILENILYYYLTFENNRREKNILPSKPNVIIEAIKMYLIYCKNLPKIEFILLVSARAITPFKKVSVFTLIGVVDCFLNSHPTPVMINSYASFIFGDFIVSWHVSDHLRELFVKFWTFFNLEIIIFIIINL